MRHLATRPWTKLRRMPRRDQRGDVPGWVLITVMTAALVAGLLAIAGPELNQMLREALASVG
jgi:Tfp pilus assembly protein PilX